MPTTKLIEGHAAFRDRYRADLELYDRLADEGQHPRVMWIGCADSRVIPELITGADPGEVFVVRNIANIVPPASSPACATGAAIEYAVRHLGVEHIVICGHTECGGIAALADEPDPGAEPHIVSWIEFARPARAEALRLEVADHRRPLETVRANVMLQLDNLRTYPCVIDGEREGGLHLHGWLYDLHTGSIRAVDPGTRTWEPIAHRSSRTDATLSKGPQPT